MNHFLYRDDSKIVICNKETVDSIRKHVTLLSLFLKETSTLTESYILDYFVEKLWTCLPTSWSDIVMNFEIQDLELFLSTEKQMKYKSPWPLSLLAFRATAISLALPRKPVKSLKCIETFIKENFKVTPLLTEEIDWCTLDSAYDNKSGQHKNIPEFCRRHVKPKKQHEIFCMAQLISAVLKAFDVKCVIDIGSGQGHLSRLLALCHKLKVATVEAEKSYISSAANFDKQAFKTMNITEQNVNMKKGTESYDTTTKIPYHLAGCMTAESSKDFIAEVFKKYRTECYKNDYKETFALLGLHTCGDLSTTILKNFTDYYNSKVLFSVGCCYMKLSSNKQNIGYPLSSYVKSLPYHHLSYEAKEMACHAVEMYIQRLKENAPSLKIHCYRATLEKCITHYYPENKHMGLRGVKHAEKMEFSEYAKKALSKMPCSIPKDCFYLPEIHSCLSQWKKVLTFYSLRLIIAPVVETLILLDRMLYLFEHGVGKTTIAGRIDAVTISPQINNGGAMFANCNVVIGQKSLHMQISDISGREKLRCMGPIYCKDAKAALCVFDLTSEKTFQELLPWINSIKNYANDECLLTIIGNKADLPNRQVSYKMAQKCAKSVGAKYFEVSAFSGQGLLNVIIYLAKHMMFWNDCFLTYAAKRSITTQCIEYPAVEEKNIYKEENIVSSDETIIN